MRSTGPRKDALTLAPPISANALERLRLKLRVAPPSVNIGAHLNRQSGQSLEFRDYRAYEPGADIRKVDWSASARHGFDGSARMMDRVLVRNFETETSRNLVIVLDTRPAMRLPEAAPKLLIGYWLAMCMIQIALQESDEVVFCLLSTRTQVVPIRSNQKAGLQSLQGLADVIFRKELSEADWNDQTRPDMRPIFAHLEPTSAVLLISDMLFADDDRRFATLARHAQQGHRSLHIAEIDSWPHEMALLQAQPFDLAPIERTVFEGNHFEATAEFAKKTRAAIDARLHAHQFAFRGPGLIWPPFDFVLPAEAVLTPSGIRHWFSERLVHSKLVRSLVIRGMT